VNSPAAPAATSCPQSMAEGHYVCLNMLRPPADVHAEAYSGWSSAYTVHALLMQLSSFLFAENVPQDYGGPHVQRTDESSAQRARQQAASFHRSKGAEFPPLPVVIKLQEGANRPPVGDLHRVPI
jgi:hypothetical protein